MKNMSPNKHEQFPIITHDLSTTGTKSCCVIARDLIKAGEDPETLLEFIRRSPDGTTPVFLPMPLRWWSERRVREADNNGPMRFERYYAAPEVHHGGQHPQNAL
jgi:hypothetical protein